MRVRIENLLSALAVIGLAGPAQAGHHSWNINEIYSNFNGTKQFIEMHCPVSGENGLATWTIVQGANTFTFTGGALPGSTLNKHVLVATSGFAALPGSPAPDYVLASNFLALGGGTLNYAGGADIWAHGAVPTDGVNSLNRTGGVLANSPTNYSDNAGQVNANVVPSLGRWALVAAVGALLLAASGMLRRRTAA